MEADWLQSRQKGEEQGVQAVRALLAPHPERHCTQRRRTNARGGKEAVRGGLVEGCALDAEGRTIYRKTKNMQAQRQRGLVRCSDGGCAGCAPPALLTWAHFVASFMQELQLGTWQGTHCPTLFNPKPSRHCARAGSKEGQHMSGGAAGSMPSRQRAGNSRFGRTCCRWTCSLCSWGRRRGRRCHLP